MNIFFATLIFITSSSIFANELAIFDSHFNDFQENLVEAKDNNKSGIFVFFHLDDCPFCEKMRKNVLNEPEVLKLYKKQFLNYAVDANGSLEIVDFKGNDTTQREFASKQYNVFATPVLVFFDLNGKLVFQRTGFVNKKDFLLLANFVVAKQYQKESFMRYKIKNRRKNLI